MTLGAFCNTVSFIFDYDSGHIGRGASGGRGESTASTVTDQALRTQISDPGEGFRHALR